MAIKLDEARIRLLKIGASLMLRSDNEGGNVRLYAPNSSTNCYEWDVYDGNLRLYYSTTDGYSSIASWHFKTNGELHSAKFVGALNGNADTASALTSITTVDAASSSAAWRRIWMCYVDNATGRPAYDDRFAIQTSTGTLKAPIFSGNLTGNAATATLATKAIALRRNDANATAKLEYSNANKTSYGWGLILTDANGKNAYLYFSSTKDSEAPSLMVYGADGLTNATILSTKNTVTVAQGGTGATTAAGARSNLGTMSAIFANGYYGMGSPDGNTADWIRTTNYGIIPYQSGGASALGTQSWPFNSAYINTVYGNLSGNATTASYPYGFASYTSGATWGNTTGTSIACWNDSTGGSVDWRRDNPSSGKISMKVDGRVFVNEGNNPVMGMNTDGQYWGMGDPDGNSTNWIRTTTSGIIPAKSGGASTLGTSSWPFNSAYINTVYGNLSGNSNSATYLMPHNSAVSYYSSTWGNMGTNVWGMAFRDTALGSDTGDIGLSLTKYSDSQVTLNLKIDGLISAGSARSDGLGFMGNLQGNATSATYTTQLLGVQNNGSNTPYDAIEGNLIRAVWNVQGDSRWYLKAGSFNCRVNYADNATTATTAAKLGRDGNTSYPMVFYWNGQGGQPNWLWGGNDGTNMYVYNPSNFNVNYANSSGNSNWLNGNSTLQYGANGLNYFNASLSAGNAAGANDAPTSDWYHIIRQNHPNGNGYYFDIASCFHNDNMYYKRVASGTTNGWRHIWVQGNSITGAVWNDYAEYRESDCKEFGYVLTEQGDDTLTKTTERLQPFAGVSSDTWGFCQGETEKAKTPIAVAGRVLVYTYQDRNNYKPGDCVCAAPGGTVDIMTREEIIQYPDRIVGTVSCVPEYLAWGSGDRDPVDVNDRIWIKV